MKTFDDSIRLSDLALGAEVRILGNLEDVIVTAQPPRSEAELAELEKPTAAEVEQAAIEGLTKEAEKKVGEEAAESEAESAKEEKAALPPESAKAEKGGKGEEKKDKKA